MYGHKSSAYPKSATPKYSYYIHGQEGKAVYTAGVDQKTVQFSLVRTSSTEKGPSGSRWTQTCSRRMHSHDVRALAIWPPYTPLPSSYSRQFAIDVAPVLTSGGLDMSVVLTPAALPTSTIVKITNPLNTSTDATFEDSYHRKLSYVSKGSVRVSRGARLVSCAREAGLSVWRIQKRPNEDGVASEARETQPEIDLDDGPTTEPFAGGWDKVLEMDLNVHSNIVGHEISDDGKWLAVSDLYESKLFSLRTDVSLHPTIQIISKLLLFFFFQTDGQVNLKRIKDFSAILQAHIPAPSTHPISTGAAAFQFTPDSSRLVMSTALSSYILIIDLTGEKPRVLRRFDHHRMQDSIVHDRVVKGRPPTSNKDESKKVNGHVVNGDVEMADPEESSPPPEKPADESEENEEEGSEDEDVSSTAAIVSVDCITVSTDGQWLATSDSRSRTHIFNLDLISVRLFPNFAHI